MGFVLLHDKYGDALFIAVDKIISAESIMYGAKQLTKIVINHDLRDESNVFYVAETVTEIYDLINKTPLIEVSKNEKPRDEDECT